MMRKLNYFHSTLVAALALLFWTGSGSGLYAQEQFSVDIEAISVNGSPGVHSGSVGTYDGKWLYIGGRIDGLHAPQPFNAFNTANRNEMVWVIDPVGNQTWSASLTSLPQDMFEALASSNPQFRQEDTTLYIVGGYGYRTSVQDHATFNTLTAIGLPGLMQAVINGQSIAPHIRQITDNRLAITGGQMGKMNDYFYLVFGHQFDGRYNPHGGASYTQTYSNEIRKFKIVDDGTNLSIQGYSSINDPVNFHRRDYNLVPQIFPNGDFGYTAFTGVFQPNADLPYLNVIDIDTGWYQVVPGFEQKFNQYHTAKMPVFDAGGNYMYSFFFGGIGMYTWDAVNASYVVDSLVPFVKTVSKVTRDPVGNMTETAENWEMPTYLGANMEFIPLEGISLYQEGIINLNALSGRTHVGYLMGGIKSPEPNTFPGNTSVTSPNDVVYKVYIDKTAVGRPDEVAAGYQPFRVNVFPNPVLDQAQITFHLTGDAAVNIRVVDANGRLISSLSEGTLGAGEHRLTWQPGSEVASGIYFLEMMADGQRQTVKVRVK